VYHFHTRTKTARAPELQAAAPGPWVELSAADAESLAISDGDIVEVGSPRGSIRAPARITDIRAGSVFVPFHYGYWDTDDGRAPDGEPRAANELTISDWDPASKQPLFKAGAVAVRRA
jgi:anaerobic selenocysteine-containing dehydrogenase